MQYFYSYSSKVFKLFRASSACPYYVIVCPATNLAAISSPHSLHWTRPFVSPDRWGPPLLSVSCMPSTTDSLPPGRGGRPYRLSYQRFPLGPPYQTGRPGYKMHPGTSRGLTMQPCHFPCRRGQPGAYPTFHARPAPLLPLPSPSHSVSLPHPPPH